MSLEQARVYAQAGKQALDSIEAFKGWREVIDKDALDMEYPYTCVLGQVAKAKLKFDVKEHEPYHLGWRYLHNALDNMAETYAPLPTEEQLGFMTTSDVTNVTWDDLKQAWLEILNEPNTTP